MKYDFALYIKICFRLQLRLGSGFGLGLAFFKHLCDNKAHHKLAYNVGNTFDIGGRNYTKLTNWLPVMIYLVGLGS